MDLVGKYYGATYFKHLQEKGNEVKLERVRYTQLHTMKRIMYKDKHIDRADWKDEFALYWIGFLKGEYKSINDYLQRKQLI